MIHHIVLWRLNGESAGQRVEQGEKIKAALEALNGRIPGLRHLEVGIDISGTDCSADVALYSKFDDAVALANYQKHPEHLRAKDLVSQAASERYVVDYLS